MKVKLYGLMLGIGTLLAACTIPSDQEKSPENEDYLIAYNVLFNEEADDYEIFTMKLDGSNKTNITQDSAVDWTYHAFDKKILFISDRDSCKRCAYHLFEMAPDGSDLKRITELRLADSWMDTRKNGTEIMVRPHASVDSAFYIINREGKVLQKIYTGLSYAYDPAFSSDGQQIVFRGALKKSKREEGFVDELYLISANGGNPQQLTHYPPADTTAPWYAYKAGTPRWHPTENFISYQSLQNGKYSLYAVTPDGQKQWKLTDNVQEEGWHAWSPDGKWLAIELFDPDQTQFHIGLMDWESKEVRVLTDTTYVYQQAPVFVFNPAY